MVMSSYIGSTLRQTDWQTIGRKVTQAFLTSALMIVAVFSFETLTHRQNIALVQQHWIELG
jgi:hypothetical protein